MMGAKRAAVLPAKLTVPKADKATPRDRLFMLLDEACHRPVVWLGAPAGSGKTTLAASYLAARKIKPLWYQCDARDADPATFFAYLRQAIGKLSPRKRETLPLLTPEYALGLPVFTLNFFEQLFARMRAPAAVVFDNFQELPATSPIQDLWQSLVTVLPEGVNLIFISRTSPPKSMVPLRATRQLTVIDADELQLDDDEAQQIGGGIAAEHLTVEEVVRYNEKVNGWAAGLVLLLQGAKLDNIETSNINADVFDYFAAEIMRSASAETQTFLARSALLPVMDVESTTALSGNARAEAILRDLVRRNYFISRLPGTTMRYEFHPLFRDFLLNALHNQCDSDALHALQQQAGDILIERGEYSAAVALLRDAGAYEELARLVLSHAERLVSEGQFETLAQWLQVLPEETYQSQPWLIYWLGISRMPFDMVAAKKQFETAYAAFGETNDAVGMTLSWVGVVDTILNLLDSFHDLEPWLDALDSAVGEYCRQTPPLMVHIAPRAYGALVMCRPEHPHLAQWKAAALDAFEAEQNLSLKLMGGFYLSVTAIWSDDFSTAKDMLLRLRRVGEANAAIPAARIVRELFESWLNWLSGNAEQAQQAAASGIAIGQQSGARLWEPLMLVEALVSAITAGDISFASGLIEQLKPFLPYARRWDKVYFYHESGWLAALKADYAEAMRLQTNALQLMLEMGGLLPQAEIHIGMAQAFDLNGKRDERDAALAVAQQIAERTGSPLMTFSASFVAAAYALADGDEAQAKHFAIKAMQTGSVQGYRNFTWWLPQQASRLSAFALEQDIESTYVRELIRVRGLVPTEESFELDTWPWPVRIYTLGRFSLVLDEQPTAFAGKGQSKVIELLKVIIALGGRDVAEQKISDLLWPDAEGDQARQSLKVTLHRLRKLIGQESVILSEGHVSLDSRRVWVDAWAFERLLNTLETVDDSRRVQIANNVIDRYNGGFLPGDVAAWVLSARERLRSRFLRIIGRAAERLCDQERWQAAIDCYQKALETDPLAERFYIGLMRCHHQLGQKAEGLAVYRRCQETLTNELQITPSTETEQWHKALRDGE